MMRAIAETQIPTKEPSKDRTIHTKPHSSDPGSALSRTQTTIPSADVPALNFKALRVPNIQSEESSYVASVQRTPHASGVQTHMKNAVDTMPVENAGPPRKRLHASKETQGHAFAVRPRPRRWSSTGNAGGIARTEATSIARFALWQRECPTHPCSDEGGAKRDVDKSYVPESLNTLDDIELLQLKIKKIKAVLDAAQNDLRLAVAQRCCKAM